MTIEERKPREFKRVIRVVYDVDVGKHGAYSEWIANKSTTIHLIEYSAYDKQSEALSIALAALECNKTFHSLGGLDDCEPCKAKKRISEVLK